MRDQGWPLAGYNTVETLRLGHSGIRARVLGVGSGAWLSCLGPGERFRFAGSFLWPLVRPGSRRSSEGPSGDHSTRHSAVAAMPAQLCLHCLAITGTPVHTAPALGDKQDQKLIRHDKDSDTGHKKYYKVESIVNKEVTVIELS